MHSDPRVVQLVKLMCAYMRVTAICMSVNVLAAIYVVYLSKGRQLSV